MYFERLEVWHKSVADTEINLAAAYEMLSRKVTICMELPPAERRSRPEEKTYKFQAPEYKEPEEMKDFDELPEGAKAGPKEKKVVELDGTLFKIFIKQFTLKVIVKWL